MGPPSASRTARSPEPAAAACATALSRAVLTKDDDGRTVHVTGDARIDLRAAGTDNDADARTDSDAVELVRTVDAPGRQYEVRPDHPGTARISVPDPDGFTVTVVVCR